MITLQGADCSYPLVGSELELISKNSQKNIYDGVWLQELSRLQAVHLYKSDLHHACLPRNLRIAFVRNILE